MKSLLRYFLLMLAIGAALELACRHWQPLLLAASHRGLFKSALLQRRLPQDMVFLGTSRTGEALRPGVITEALAQRGLPRPTAFNLSVQYSSLDLLHALATQFSAAPGLKLAIIEISRSQLVRGTLPWAQAAVGNDAGFDARAFAWLEQHSALAAQRKAFVLDSLARLAAVTLAASRFDGTEQFGVDYVAPILGGTRDVASLEFHLVECVPRPVDAAGDATVLAAEREIYASMAKAFGDQGVSVVFYVPPMTDAARATESEPAHRSMRAVLHAQTGRPIWDFADCQLPADYFRDEIHMSHLGGSHFSTFIARAIADDTAVAAALGARGAHALQ